MRVRPQLRVTGLDSKIIFSTAACMRLSAAVSRGSQLFSLKYSAVLNSPERQCFVITRPPSAAYTLSAYKPNDYYIVCLAVLLSALPALYSSVLLEHLHSAHWCASPIRQDASLVSANNL